MAQLKQEVLTVGSGDSSSDALASRIISSNVPPSTWLIGATYAAGNVVEYSGAMYRSLTNSNIGNTPAGDLVNWLQLIENVKDGDFCFVILGSASNFYKRAGGIWTTVGTNLDPSVATLVDNQVSPATAFSYLATSFSYAQIEYTIRRGTDYTQQRGGILRIVADPAGSGLNWSEEADPQLGADVGVTFTPVISGSTVNVQYVSTNLGLGISLTYRLLGWEA